MAKTRAKRSAIWRYFSEFNECDKSTLVKCNACNVALPFCRNTTNLWSHIRIHHKGILDSIPTKQYSVERPQKNPSIHWNATMTDCSQPTSTIESMQIPSTSHSTDHQYPTVSKRSVEITNALLLMIAEDVYPFSIVNDRGFVNFVRTLDESYQLPDKSSLTTKYLPALYASKCKEIEDKLSSVECIHLTIDSWTEANRRMTFFAITAHFYARDALQRNTLRVSYMPSQCASKIHEMVDQTVKVWNIRSKVKTIVCDSMNKVANATPNWQTISCFEHTVSMVVHNAIKENGMIISTLHKCRDIVRVFKTNNVVAETLRNKKIQQNLSRTVTLRMDVAGRWKTTYSMLRNIMELRCILSTMQANLFENNVAYITEKEWEIISGTIQVLKPFYEATGEVFGDCHVTISKIIPIVHCIQVALASQENLIEDVMFLRVNLLNELGICFEDIEMHPVYSIATFLDPRYKNIAFHSKECVRLVENRLTSQFKLRKDGSTDAAGCASNIQQGRNETDDVNDTLWAEFDKKVQKTAIETVYSSDSLKDELERYLLLKPINRKSNPITWWNAEGKTLYPKLMNLALEYLCVPATCVSNEQQFAKVGQILSQRRTRIQSKYVNMLSILHLNRNK